MEREDRWSVAHESPCPQHVTRTHSPVAFVNAVTSHEVGVDREGGAKVGRYSKSGVDGPACVVSPAIAYAAAAEPETPEEFQASQTLTSILIFAAWRDGAGRRRLLAPSPSRRSVWLGDSRTL